MNYLIRSQRRIVFGVLLISVFFARYGAAQDNFFKTASPPSANVAALGKFADIPVSHHTGVPNISIPVYTVSQGELTLPVTLDYHSSGVKTDELSSWVGLGWSLNAGGMITRQVVGAPDEGGVGRAASPFSDLGAVGWYKDYGISPRISQYCETHPGAGLFTSDQNGNLVLEDSRWRGCRFRNLDVANGIADTEPDMYNFNFAGFSGKFFFDNNRNVVMQPLQDVVIQPILGTTSTGGMTFDQWLIITPDGTHYYFGGASATERTYFGESGVASPNNSSYSSSSWYLTKMVNMNKTDSILFTYTSQPYSFATPQPHTVFISSFSGYQGGIDRAPLNPNITFVDGMVLNKIQTSSGLITLNFNSTTLRQDVTGFRGMLDPNISARQLDAIQIITPKYQTQFNFSYSYFVSDNNAADFSDNKRLRLDNIQEVTPTESKPPHVFTYETSIKMPRRLTMAKDHWGYYNGADGNIGLIPNVGPTVTVGGGTVVSVPYSSAIRTPKEDKMQVGILKSIQYPTGGTTQFIYEAHRQSVNNPADIVGGLRIYQIVQNDLVNPPVTKTYVYSEAILYTGQFNYVVSMDNNPTSRTYYLSQSQFGVIISSEIKPAIRTTQGYHIGYTVVKEVISGNGYTEYNYTNLSPQSYTYEYPVLPAQSPLGGGQLMSEKHYDDSGNILKSTAYTYNNDFQQSITALKIVQAHAAAIMQGPNGHVDEGGPMPILAEYQIQTGRRLLIKKEEFMDGVTTTTYYRYSPNHQKPVQTVVIDSKGVRTDLLVNYNADNVNLSCSNPNAASCFSNYDTTTKSIFEQYIATGSLEPNVLDNTSTAFLNCQTYGLYTPCWPGALQSSNALEKLKANMVANNYNVAFGSKKKVNGVQTEGDSTSFKMVRSQIVPFEHYVWDNQLKQLTRRTAVNLNGAQRINTLQKESDVPVSYQWGHNSYHMVAEIKNASSSLYQYSQWTASTASQDFALSGPANTSVGTTQTIRVDYTGMVTLKIGVSVSPPPTYSTVVSYTLASVTNGTITAAIGSCGITNVEFANVAPGTYALMIGLSSPDTGVTTLSACGQITYPSYVPVPVLTGNAEFLYQGFEETPVSSGAVYNPDLAKTGNYYFGGDYTVSFTLPNARSYVIEYWYLDSSNTWQFLSKPYSGPTMVLTEGSGLDEVRIRPVDSQMTTYSYEPGIGIRSATDFNHVSTYYTYDSFGRLLTIRDDKKKLLKVYQYNYKK